MHYVAQSQKQGEQIPFFLDAHVQCNDFINLHNQMTGFLLHDLFFNIPFLFYKPDKPTALLYLVYIADHNESVREEATL